MRGIILAGGAGTRLQPLTLTTSKQLLPVYDKPMIYYPLSVLMLGGITDILIITAPGQADQFQRLLGDGRQFGLNLAYAVQDHPRGLADALLIGRNFIGDEPVCLVLGDNIFYGHELTNVFREAIEKLDGCTLFGYQVADPERYGVATINDDGRLVDIEEKPKVPRSNIAITGLYLYDNEAVRYAAELTPSPRGDLEITDVNRRYVQDGRANLVTLGRGTAWLDTGTPDSLLDAGVFVQVLQKRQGIQIACLEEVAFRMGFIDDDGLAVAIDRAGHDSARGRYLSRLRQVA
jgi:glucose-1-phosphate thymidylyltransferase